MIGNAKNSVLDGVWVVVSEGEAVMVSVVVGEGVRVGFHTVGVLKGRVGNDNPVAACRVGVRPVEWEEYPPSAREAKNPPTTSKSETRTERRLTIPDRFIFISLVLRGLAVVMGYLVTGGFYRPPIHSW